MSTQPAGEGLSDEQMVEQVEEQTSSDLKAEPAFEQEADGATSEEEAAESLELEEPGS